MGNDADYDAVYADDMRYFATLDRLKDPIAVHASMLRGAIAKPSIANIVHLYRPENLADEVLKGLSIEEIEAYLDERRADVRADKP